MYCKHCFCVHVATRDTIEMSKKMADAGADALLVVTPSYYKNAMTNAALEQHFIKVYTSYIILLYIASRSHPLVKHVNIAFRGGRC